jgi:ubiquinone/menaquinone biosynthesis C-methylase UbiE
LFSRLLLESKATVYGIEPNNEMRERAEMDLADVRRFNSVAGSAEEIPLGDKTVDIVTAAQAYHWFDFAKARNEFLRILRPPGWVALVWNVRRFDSTEFHKDYERLLTTWGVGYKGPLHGQDDLGPIDQMFQGKPYERWTFPNPQFLFWEELQGRAQSASYFPLPEHDNYGPAIAELRQIFEKHKVGGRVNFDYSTELFLGRLLD